MYFSGPDTYLPLMNFSGPNTYVPLMYFSGFLDLFVERRRWHSDARLNQDVYSTFMDFIIISYYSKCLS